MADSNELKEYEWCGYDIKFLEDLSISEVDPKVAPAWCLRGTNRNENLHKRYGCRAWRDKETFVILCFFSGSYTQHFSMYCRINALWPDKFSSPWDVTVDTSLGFYTEVSVVIGDPCSSAVTSGGTATNAAENNVAVNNSDVGSSERVEKSRS